MTVGFSLMSTLYIIILGETITGGWRIIFQLSLSQMLNHWRKTELTNTELCDPLKEQKHIKSSALSEVIGM